MSINELTDEMIAKYFPMLTEARQKKIASMNDVEKRKIAFCCEMLARQCLSRLCDAPEFSFNLLCNPNGKSVVGNFDCEICIVQAEDIVGCAVSENYIGLGIKLIQPFTFKAAQDLFSDSEIRMIFSDSRYSFSEIVNLPSCDETRTMQKFALFSSLKDAYFYSSGRGIRSEIKNTYFSFNGKEIICSDNSSIIKSAYLDKTYSISVSVIERYKK